MLKRFMYAAIGVLALSLTLHLGANSGRAALAGRNIIALGDHQGWAVAVMSTGEVFAWHSAYAPNWLSADPLPFPADQLRAFDGWHAADSSNNMWLLGRTAWEWELIGPPPGAAGIPDGPELEPSTWGKIKHRGVQ